MMAPLRDPIELYFVDREQERTEVLANSGGSIDPRIYCIESENGWGKTWLLKKLAREGAELGWRVAYLSLDEGACADAEKLLRKIGKEMGGTLQDNMDQVRDPGRIINIQSSGAVSTGDVIAGDVFNVVVNGNMVEKPVIETVDPHGYDMRVRALTQIFVGSITDLLSPQWASLFLDNFEAATTPVLNWLTEEIFHPIRDGKIDRLQVVMACNARPTCLQAEEWKIAVCEQPLSGLKDPDLQIYFLQKRSLPAKYWDTFHLMALGVNGQPSLVAMFADSLALGQRRGS